jgi:hypothetical protein
MAIPHSGNRPESFRIGKTADMLPTRQGVTVPHASTAPRARP